MVYQIAHYAIIFKLFIDPLQFFLHIGLCDDSSTYDLQTQQPFNCTSLTLIHLDYNQTGLTCPTNPERGWFFFTQTHTNGYTELEVTSLRGIRENDNITLIYRGVVLDNYRNTSIANQTLASLSNDLLAIRTAGLKVIFRFMYTNVFTSPRNDAPKSVVLEHISQLGPILNANADVIFSIQHGFIGTWGEGFYTDHFGDQGTINSQQWDDRREVFQALLANFPKCRMLQVRTWQFKKSLTEISEPVQQDNAFRFTNDSSGNSRTGISDNCFLGSETDQGTWESSAEKALLSQHTHYTVTGGESCFVNVTNNDRVQCPTAIEELTNFHFTYLHGTYYGPVLDTWRTGGCYDDISCHLGYNLVLVSSRFPSTVTSGGEWCFELTIRNDGYAPPYNKHVLVLVLKGNNQTLSFDLEGENTDSRVWTGNGTTHQVKPSVTLNDTQVTLGQWNLFLALLDAAPSLRNRSEYNIVFSNPGISTSDRLNDLNVTINVADCYCNGHTAQCSTTPPTSCDCIHNTTGDMVSVIAMVTKQHVVLLTVLYSI